VFAIICSELEEPWITIEAKVPLDKIQVLRDAGIVVMHRRKGRVPKSPMKNRRFGKAVMDELLRATDNKKRQMKPVQIQITESQYKEFCDACDQDRGRQYFNLTKIVIDFAQNGIKEIKETRRPL